MSKIKSVNVLMRQSGMVDEETGKLICPKDFIIRAYVYYDIAISLGKIDSYYLANKVEEEKKNKDLNAIKGNYQNIEFGSQIRSYVMHPYSMVKDHRTNVETSNVTKVLDGDLDLFIERYLKGE